MARRESFYPVEISNEKAYSLDLRFSFTGKYIAENDKMIHERRVTDHFTLFYGVKQSLFMTIGDQDYELKPNDYLILPPFKEHVGTKESEPGLTYYWVHFFCDDYKLSVDDNGRECVIFGQDDVYNIPLHGTIKDTAKIHLLCQQILDTYVRSGLFCSTICANYTKIIIAEIAEHFYNVRNNLDSDNKLNNIIDWISLNATKIKSVGQVATRFGYNPEYLTTLVKQVTGKSLKEYINARRIHAAKKLLRNTDLSIKEIADACGYQDDKYFSRIFKKYQEVSPNVYRKTAQKQWTNSIELNNLKK